MRKPEPLNVWLVVTVVVASSAFLHACGTVVRNPGMEAGRDWQPPPVPPAPPQRQAAIDTPPEPVRPGQTEIARVPPVAPLPPVRPFGPPGRVAPGVQVAPQVTPPGPRRAQMDIARQARTGVVNFETAPFPYEGMMPGSGRPFLDVNEEGRRGHRTGRGQVLWEDETFKSSGVLMHIPQGFDPNKPGVIVVFFHGHGATVARDVQYRQQVPAQISRSTANAVLIAPQFAANAANSSPGKFWQRGGFARFLDEAAEQLATMHGDARAARMFMNMPVVLVSYSGGYLPTAWVLRNGDAKDRIRGVVLLDSLYGELNTFADWKLHEPSSFLISAHLGSTRTHNLEFAQMLGEHMTVATALQERIAPGSVAVIAGTTDDNHRDFVSRAFGTQPVAAILDRMPGIARRGGALALSRAR